MENMFLPKECTYAALWKWNSACPSHLWHNWTATMHPSRFHRASMWPLNSPDFNPMDYAIWSVIQQCVYEIRAHDVDELWQHLLHVGHCLEQSLIDEAIDQWPTRLLAWIHASSGLCLMNCMFHAMLDAAGDILRVCCKNMKCDVSFLPCNAMLVWYMLLSCVFLSVSLSVHLSVCHTLILC